MRRAVIGAAAAVGVLVAGTATAQMGYQTGFRAGGSNFGAFGYPAHSCGGAPVLPLRPTDMTSARTVNEYNREVDAYNSRLAVFSECISAYVARATNDVETIRRLAADASATLQPSPRR